MNTDTLHYPSGSAAGKQHATETVLEVSGLSPKAAKLSRIFEFLVVAAVIMLFTGAIHLHVLLLAGDWDMFLDWKDRQFWPLRLRDRPRQHGFHGGQKYLAVQPWLL